MIRRIDHAAWCLVASAMLAGPATAIEAAEPAPIPGGMIPTAASDARLALDAMGAHLEVGDPKRNQDARVIASAIDRLTAQRDLARLGEVPAFRLDELASQVAFYRQRVERMQAQQLQRVTRLSDDAAAIADMTATWRLTVETARADNLSQPLQDEAAAVLRLIAGTRRELDSPLKAALAQREAAARLDARLGVLEVTIEDAESRVRQRYFESELPPIWRGMSLSLPTVMDREAMAAQVEGQLAYSRDYFQANRQLLQLWAFFLALLAGALAWASRRPAWSRIDTGLTPDAGRLLQHPLSALVLIALSVTLLVMDLAPSLVRSAASLATMGLLLRVLPRRLVARRYLLILALAVVFVIDRGRALIPYDSPLFRASQLLVAGGLALILWKVIALRRRSALQPDSWLALLAPVAPTGLLLVIGATAANLLGNLSLADLLLGGTTLATYASAILFATATVLDDLVLLVVNSPSGRRLKMIELHGSQVRRVFRGGVHLLAVAFWAYLTLQAFTLWDPVEQLFRRLLTASLTLGQLTISIGDVVAFVLGVLLATYSARLTRFLLQEEVLTRLRWPPGVRNTTATLAYYAVLFVGLLMAMAIAGIEPGQVALVVGALGVGIGFGLQTVVNNFVSGLILMFERPIQPGDVIDVDTLQGRVAEIGLRATRIRTWEGAEVVVPNGDLLSGKLVNWTLSDSDRRIEIAVGVAYGSDVRQVQQLLLEVARSQPTALALPEPVVVMTGFGDSSLDFSIRFWIRDADAAPVAKSEACMRIMEVLREAGIEIPFPQRDLHLRSVPDRLKT